MSQYRLNWKFLVGSLVVVAAAGGALHFRYKQQVGRQADTLLELANGADQKAEPVKAIGFLRRYLVFRPQDHDARGRLGVLLVRNARQPNEYLQAYFVLDETLRSAPKRDDLRRKALDLALQLGPDLLPDAERHLKKLITDHPKDGELYVLFADYHLLQNQYAEAAGKLKEATDQRGDLHLAHLRRARILREKLDQQKEADGVIVDMLKQREGAFGAHLAAAAYWDTDTADRQADRAEAVGKAVRLAPDELEVILAVADLKLSQGHRAFLQGKSEERKSALDEARTALRRGTARYAPTLQKLTAEEASRLDDAALGKRVLVGLLYQKLAVVETQAGDLAAAEAAAREGVAALPESLFLLASLLDIHIRQGRYEPDATGELDRLEQGGYPQASVRYQRGRILGGQGKWLEAARTIEEVLADPRLPAEFVPPASLLLGTAYEEIGELDRRYAAYKRATAAEVRDPLWLTANERLAATLVEMGQFEEASRLLETLAPRAAGANIPLARVRLAQALRRPPAERQWGPVELALQAAPKGIEKDLGRADLEVARGDLGKAAEVLQAAVKEYPDAIRPQLALALTEAQRKNAARAAELIATARAKFGHTADVRLAEARLIALAPGEDAAARLSHLAEGAEQLPNRDARRLLRGLAEIATAAGASEAAVALRDRTARAAPDDLGAHLARFDDAMSRKDLKTAEAVRDRIRQLDGPDGTNTRVAEAFLIIAKAHHKEPADLNRAGELLDAVERQRQWWHRAALAQGMLADLKQDPARAAARFKDAVVAGERRPEVVQRLLALYASLGLAREAEEVLALFSDPADVARGNELLVVDLSLRSGNFARALDVAARAIPDSDTDPRKLLLLAQIRRAAGEPVARVEAPIRRAVELAGDRPDGWVALVRLLATSGRRDQAEAEIDRARTRLGDREKLALAQCFEAVGRIEQARPLYEAAAEDRPDDGRTLREVLEFHLRMSSTANPQDAEKATKIGKQYLGLRDLPVDDKQYALDVLAQLEQGKSDYRTTRQRLEAIGLLERGLPVPLSGRETLAQLRARFQSLAREPDAKLRREAIVTAAAIDLRQPLRPEEQYLVAQLLISVGQWPEARGRLKGLTETRNPNLVHVAYYGLRVLLLDDRPNKQEARRCLELLDKGLPNAPVTLELKVRLLDAEGNLAGAVEAVKGYVGTDASRAGVGGLLLERLGAVEPAEALYRTFAGDPKRVGGTIMLAGFLGRQGRTDQALAFIGERAGTLPPVGVAGLGTEVLYHSPKVGAAEAQQVEGWIRLAAEKGLPEADALTLRAVVRVAEGRYDDAIRLYEAAVGKGTPDPLTMNNLGYLLAIQGGRAADGLAWVRKARDAAGPQPGILDTEAVILTATGEPQKAIELLVEATRETPDPVAFFHLAEAYSKAGDPAAAAAAMRQAVRWKIRLIDVPPQERQRLADALRTVRR